MFRALYIGPEIKDSKFRLCCYCQQENISLKKSQQVITQSEFRTTKSSALEDEYNGKCFGVMRMALFKLKIVLHSNSRVADGLKLS